MNVQESIVQAIESQDWLDIIGKRLQKGVKQFYTSSPAAIRLRDFFHGVGQGHPLHAILTDVTFGAYMFTGALDILERFSGWRLRPGVAKAADVTLGIGVASALGTAVTGITDWQHTSGTSRRVGMMHAMLNSSALVLFVLSLLARKRGARGAGRGLSFGGLLISAAAGWLGGHLAYGYRIGVNHSPSYGLPKKFTPLMAEDDLPADKPVRAMLDTTPLLLVRQNGSIYAISETCAHLGGPLSEGELSPDGGVICPWHGSHFALEDGSVRQGPSVYPQPCFEVRVRKGQIEVCHRPNAFTRDA